MENGKWKMENGKLMCDDECSLLRDAFLNSRAEDAESLYWLQCADECQPPFLLHFILHASNFLLRYLAQRTQRAQRQAVDCNALMNAHHCELPTFVYRSSLLRLPNSLAHTSMPTTLPASLHTSYFLLPTSFVFVDKIIGILI